MSDTYDAPAVKHRLVVSAGRDSAAHLELAPRVDEFGARHDIPRKAILALQVALDEIITNIVSYGFEDDAEHHIDIHLRVADDALEVEIIDDGRPFNLIEAEDPDVGSPLEEKPIGGLGIYIVKRLMDDLEYRRCGELNRLTLRKTLSKGP